MFDFFRKKAKRSIIINGSDEDILFQSYKPLSQNEEVLKCAHKIADLVSDMTVMLLENGENGDRRVHNALSYKVDVEPNTLLTRKPFIYRIVSDMVLYGNSVVLPVIKDGLLNDLKLMDMTGVTYMDVNGGETYQIKYKGKSYAPDEVLHFVLVPSEDRPYLGQGFAPQIKETIENLGQANKTKSTFLRSKWKPPLIISVNSDAEELQDPDKRSNILNSYVSDTDEGKPWLIPADEVKVQSIRPLTLSDLKVSESIELDKRVIAATFGVPPFLLGIGQYNKDEYNTFISTVIYSFGMIIQQELTRKLLYKTEWYFKFNARSLMQYSLAEKTSHTVELMKNGMLSRNEGRNEFDYSPVDNEGMDEYVILENFIPVAKVGEQEKLLQENSKGGIIKKRGNDKHKPAGSKEGGQFDFKASASGANTLEKKGFKNKQKLNNHWENGRTHKKEYEKDGILTKEEYEQRAVELAESETSETILGHCDKNSRIIRYDTEKNDFVKADIDEGIITMFKPEDGQTYYDNVRKGDLDNGGREDG